MSSVFSRAEMIGVKAFELNDILIAKNLSRYLQMNCKIKTVNTVARMKTLLIERADGERFLSIDILVNVCKYSS